MGNLYMGGHFSSVLPQYRHLNIRAQDPDRLLRYRPPTPDSDDSSPESYAHVSHFTGGNAVTARARVRDPLAPFPDQHMHVTVAIDTYSDISVAHADIAFNIAPITEIVRTGGGKRFPLVHSHSRPDRN
jgi:hypothetical protein